MNNIECIFNFLKDKTSKKLLINVVDETIGFFYVNLIEAEAKTKSIELKFDEEFSEGAIDDLFLKNEVHMYFTNSKKNIEKCLNTSNKCIIFTDYKNFKFFTGNILTVNGYNYRKDIDYYLKKIHLIKDSEIIDYCISSPHLTFSELSKYLVNSSNYIRENKIEEKNNFILEIRKNIFNLRRLNKSSKDIYNQIKLEVKYKKFNFLTY